MVIGSFSGKQHVFSIGPLFTYTFSHFPGLFTSDKFLKIFQEQYCTMAPTTLKCAVLNVNGEELIVAGLQIKNYPSLRLVTEGGRLREWPFRIFYGISQEIVSFAAHQHWTLLPVYQKLPNLDESDWFLSFTAFQIKTFNFCLGFLVINGAFVQVY